MMRFVDLFAGLGGFHVAAATIGGRCVCASEIDERLRELYKLNFGITALGDIQQIALGDIPAHELLLAGFPCQPFSKAGGQAGLLDDERGGVLADVIRVIEHHRPKYVLLENVSHFVRHDSGHVYAHLVSGLRDLGYGVSSNELSPHHFGIPQLRNRMYLVAKHGGLHGFRWPEPKRQPRKVDIRTILDANPRDAKPISARGRLAIEAWQDFLDHFPAEEKLPSFPLWSMECGATYPFDVESLYTIKVAERRKYRGSFGRRLEGARRERVLAGLPAYARRAQSAFPSWKRTFIRQNRELFQRHRTWIRRWLSKVRDLPESYQKFEWNCQGETRDLSKFVLQFRASGLRVKRSKVAPSLVAMTTTQIPIIGWEQRHMTVRECARLQSLDSLAHLPADSRTFKALGNAVNAKVAEIILTQLCRGGDKAISTPQFAGRSPSSSAATSVGRANAKGRSLVEDYLASELWQRGIRFRRNVDSLPGKPDIVIVNARVIIFCDGEFWHGKDFSKRKRRLRKSHNGEYWVAKIEYNIERDRHHVRELTANGWHVIRVWESEIRAGVRTLANRIEREIERKKRTRSHSERPYARSRSCSDRDHARPR